jgi:GntR family transcriptional regulator/MocR family aminotransferase
VLHPRPADGPYPRGLLASLVAEGYLTAVPRSGIKVTGRPTVPPAEIASLARSWRPPVPGVDLRPGLPDLATFPRREWLAATRRVLQTAPNSAFGYGD